MNQIKIELKELRSEIIEAKKKYKESQQYNLGLSGCTISTAAGKYRSKHIAYSIYKKRRESLTEELILAADYAWYKGMVETLGIEKIGSKEFYHLAIRRELLELKGRDL